MTKGSSENRSTTFYSDRNIIEDIYGLISRRLWLPGFKALKNSMKGLKNHDREFSALSAFCKEEMNICAILHHTDNVFCCDLQYIKIKMDL